MEKKDASHYASYDQFVAVIIATESPEGLASITDKCPSILLPLGSRPVISYQLKYLAQNHIHRNIPPAHILLDVIIPIAAKHKNKLSKYLDKKTPEGMVVEPLVMEGEFTIDDILVALSTRINVLGRNCSFSYRKTS